MNVLSRIVSYKVPTTNLMFVEKTKLCEQLLEYLIYKKDAANF
jgi:hypothetical protein